MHIILKRKHRKRLYIIFFAFLLLKCAATYRNAGWDDKVSTIVNTSRTYVGTPYSYGGMSSNGMDCSGLLMLSFSAANISMPRTALDQSKMGKPIPMEDVRPGDLVFFAARKRGRKVTHAGLVTEVNGRRSVKFIHASSSRGVIEDNLYSTYYLGVFVKARRLDF